MGAVSFIKNNEVRTFKTRAFGEEDGKLEFWLSKTPEERIAALELMRQGQMWSKYERIKQKRPGVYRITRKASG